MKKHPMSLPKTRLRRPPLTIFLLCFCLLPIGSARAQSMERGIEAYSKAEFETARRIFTFHSLGGDPRAQFFLGEIYESGAGVAVDQASANRWYELAAKQNHTPALARLGYRFFRGLGTRQDLTRARTLLTHAATQNDLEAQFQLGHLMLASGDLESAYYWWSIAAGLGDPDAPDERARIAKRLNDKDKTQIDGKAMDWIRSTL